MDELCHGNWIEIQHMREYIDLLQATLREHGIEVPIEYWCNINQHSFSGKAALLFRIECTEFPKRVHYPTGISTEITETLCDNMVYYMEVNTYTCRYCEILCGTATANGKQVVG